MHSTRHKKSPSEFLLRGVQETSTDHTIYLSLPLFPSQNLKEVHVVKTPGILDIGLRGLKLGLTKSIHPPLGLAHTVWDSAMQVAKWGSNHQSYPALLPMNLSNDQHFPKCAIVAFKSWGRSNNRTYGLMSRRQVISGAIDLVNYLCLVTSCNRQENMLQAFSWTSVLPHCVPNTYSPRQVLISILIK